MIRFAVILGFSLLFICTLKAQQQKARVMFYNTENLYDPEDDSLIADEEFTPAGSRAWSNTRLYKKLNNIAKVFIAAGEWDMPAIIGLCEIENRNVINKLIHYTPLKKTDYRIAHYESPDPRGIDVALLYRADKFKMVSKRAIPIRFPGDSTSRTRDILYVKGILMGCDTLHIFVNHWPSKYGGTGASLPKRIAVARILRQYTDSLKTAGVQNILLMGDFNDTPEDASVMEVLGACRDTANCTSGLVNLMWPLVANPVVGTHKYAGHWSIIDQIIVSKPLFEGRSKLKIIKAQVFRAEFLLQPDAAHSGMMPFRTFSGFKYEGGFSDHLPIIADILVK
jgi:exonuclease III